MDTTFHSEMMSSFNSVLADKAVADNFFPSMPATAQYLSSSETNYSHLGYKMPEMSVEDAFDFMSTAPAPMV